MIDFTTLVDTPPKYVGTIGGWVKTDKCGIMMATGLQCDHTPLAPFNIISKGKIKQDKNWTLTEGICEDKPCYILTHHTGFSMKFIDNAGVFMHILTPMHAAPVPAMMRHSNYQASASTTLPQQYIDNIAQLTFNSAEKHGLMRIYPLLESGLSYGELETLQNQAYYEYQPF